MLVVEDDPGISLGLRINLEKEGYNVIVQGDGEGTSQRLTERLVPVLPPLVAALVVPVTVKPLHCLHEHLTVATARSNQSLRRHLIAGVQRENDV